MFRHRLAPRMRLRWAFVAVVAIVTSAVAAAPTPAAVHTFGTVTPGSSYGCPSQNRKYGNKYTLTETGSVTKITAYMKGNGGAPGSQVFRTMIYAADGVGGAPGTLLATSQTVSVDSAAAPGEVDFPLSSPVSLPAGDYWLAQQSGAASAKACLAGTAAGTNDFNTDSFSDGPSDPFGPASQDSNTWTLYASYETATVVHTFGTTTPGSSYGCPTQNRKYGNEYTLTETGSVTKITAYMKGAGGTPGTQIFRTMIYAADGAGGAPGTLLATSQTATVDSAAAAGEVDFPVSPAVTLSAGDYWITQQSGATSAKGCLAGTGTGTNDFNTDSFGDGPSDPFGPASQDSNTWTLYATYDTAAPGDTTPPTITGSRTPDANANGWNNTDVTVSFDCQDESGGSGVASVSGPTTVSTEGASQSVTGTCTDNAGNSASATVTDINIDKTAPSASATPSPSANGNGWNNTDVTVTFGCTDSGGSGVDTLTSPATLSSEGANQSATGTCTDKAGNSDSATASGINIDKTNPLISAGTPSPAANANGWNKTDVTVTFDCSDPGGSGAASASDVQTVSSEGAGQSATGTCTDLAGNTASATKSGINIDKTGPSVSASPSPAPNADGWNNTNVTVTYVCTDGGSGVDSAPAADTLTAEGANQSATGTCTDKAGNSASATASGINIDKTKPSITAGSPSPGPNANGWNNSNVTVTFGCSDVGGSGVVSASDVQTVSSEGSNLSATGTCTDKAGNSNSASVGGIKIDKTKPAISAGTASPAANANGWNNTNVTVTFSCSDPGGSGAVSASDVKTVSSEGASQSATGTCTDKAGNSNSATKSGINIDKTAPTIGYTGNAGTYAPSANVNITCAASDGGSGLASSTCANVTGLASSFGLGPHTFSATATDKAGNTASASTTFTVSGVTVASLCNQMKQWVQASAAYQKLKPVQKAIADLAWNVACQAAAKLPPLTPKQKQVALKVLQVAVNVLRSGGYLTPAQAQAIMDMAATL